ncbi:MAG TPA: CAP domain-containing protein, partial [Dehalococcoidia bacterium]
MPRKVTWLALLASVALALTLALAWPAARTSAAPTPSPTPIATTYDGQYDNGAIDTEEANFLVLINNYRAQNGLGALTLDTRLDPAADWKSNDMGVYNYFDHNQPACPAPDKCGETWIQVM